MVVAACAVDGDAHGGSERLRDHVIEIKGTCGSAQHVGSRFHLTDEVPRASGEEAECNEVWLWQKIACDLFAKELVVRFVGVEGVDDGVAVSPGIGAELVTFEAVRIGVVDDVEPVASLAFAEVR